MPMPYCKPCDAAQIEREERERPPEERDFMSLLIANLNRDKPHTCGK